MEIESIGKFSGIATTSQNEQFLMIHDRSDAEKPSILLVAEKDSKKPIYAYKLKYSSDTAISNQGHSAAISHNYKTDESIISCIDEEGALLYTKRTYSIPQCLAFDNECKFLVIAFAGEEKNIECYSIVWLDINSGFLIKAQQSPDLQPVFRLAFDDKNKLIVDI